MKKLGLIVSVALVLIGMAATTKAANTNVLSVTFQISGLVQKMTSVTNSGIVTTTYSTKMVKIAGKDILDMLQTEFATTYPDGAKLGYSLETAGFVVLDKNDNQIMNVMTNPADLGFSFTLSNNVAQLGSPDTISGKSVNNLATTNSTLVVTISQSNYGIFYKDSHNNNFYFLGLVVEKINGSQSDGGPLSYKTASVTLTGSGSGTAFVSKDGISETMVITTAKMSASGKNLVQ